MNTVVVANASLNGVRVAVRDVAVEDLHYFVEHVLGFKYSEQLCSEVEDALWHRRDCTVHCHYPRQFAQALSAWLGALGHNVLCSEPELRCDILNWLDLKSKPHADARAVSICTVPLGIEIQWL